MDRSHLKMVLEDLEKTLLEFMEKHRITHDQYRVATALLIDTIKAGEESLLFDVFWEAAATNISNIDRVGSGEAIEGPFYIAGAPALSAPFVMPHRADEKGDVLFFKGRITDPAGAPIVGAELDIWQADITGSYSGIHPGIPDWNLRGRIFTDEAGDYEVKTIVPPPYEIPKDGPTGRVLRAMDRHFFRPAHLHVKVRHADTGEMTSQLYFDGGDYIASDVASAVRDDLVAKLERRADPAEIAARGLELPFYELRYDFCLDRTQAKTGRAA